jgi:hypothetical protein
MLEDIASWPDLLESFLSGQGLAILASFERELSLLERVEAPAGSDQNASDLARLARLRTERRQAFDAARTALLAAHVWPHSAARSGLKSLSDVTGSPQGLTPSKRFDVLERSSLRRPSLN